jgi:hypothetical protein
MINADLFVLARHIRPHPKPKQPKPGPGPGPHTTYHIQCHIPHTTYPNWVSPIGAQNSGPFPAKSRQKASPECPPPIWDQPRPQSCPGGGLANSRHQDKTQRAGRRFVCASGEIGKDHLSRGQMNGDCDGIFDDLLQSECDGQPVFFSGVPRSVSPI